MPINSADRVWDTSTTTGTGSLTLAGSSPTGYRTFASAFATGTAYIPYCIALQGGTEWETGWGTLSGSTTLARTTVTASSNSGAAVNFSSGTKDVFVTLHKAAIAALGGGGVTTAATQATTSGTAIDFTSIPSTATLIFINLNGVSFSGADHLLVQIGDSGGIETSGYKSAGSAITSAMQLPIGAATSTAHGVLILSRLDSGGEEWMGTGGAVVVDGSSVGTFTGWGGSKTLSAALDRVRLTRSGVGSFDAGSVSISYV